jgi:transcriptional regulator with XRE-family HTH domain
MAVPTTETRTGSTSRRARAEDVDRYVGARVRQRRVMLGLTQQQMADLIGVTYQQAHKYEKGINRVAAGRLYQMARVLGVDIGYFFEGLHENGPLQASPKQRMLLDLARNFISIPTRKHQEAVCSLARALTIDQKAPDAARDA